MFARGMNASWRYFSDFQLGDFAVVTICDLEGKAIEVDAFIDLWQPSKGVQN